MTDRLEFNSRKELKELCNNFGIRTAGVKHEDLVRLLRTKLQPKNEVPRSPTLRGARNGYTKDSLPRMENRNSSGRTPKKLVNVGRTLGNVLHDANGVSAAERWKKEGPKRDVSRSVRSSARLFSHADFLVDENGQDAFSSADIDSLISFAEPSECSIDDIPYPFETTDFGNNTSPQAQKIEDQYCDGSKRSVGRDGSAASDSSLQTAPSELLLCPATGELSLFSIPDWISMSVYDPPLLDWEKNELVPTVCALGGDELREVPISECIELPDCGAMVMTEPDVLGMGSTLEHNVGSLTSADAEEGGDATNLAASNSAAMDAKFEKFSEEEYVTSEELTSGQALLPAEESVSPMLLKPGGHLPANSLDGLFKEIWEEQKDALLILGILDECALKNNDASQVQLETKAKQEVEDGGIDTDTGPEADAPAEVSSLPINSLKGFVESHKEPESLASEWAAHFLPMSIPEHTVGNDAKGHMGVERKEPSPKVQNGPWTAMVLDKH